MINVVGFLGHMNALPSFPLYICVFRDGNVNKNLEKSESDACWIHSLNKSVTCYPLLPHWHFNKLERVSPCRFYSSRKNHDRIFKTVKYRRGGHKASQTVVSNYRFKLKGRSNHFTFRLQSLCFILSALKAKISLNRYDSLGWYRSQFCSVVCVSSPNNSRKFLYMYLVFIFLQ